MAEERIAIHHCSNKCRYLREVSCDILKEEGISNGTYCSSYIHGPWQKIDLEKDCKDCKRAEYNGITRAEAVERMAKAMYEFSTDEFRGEKFPYEFEEMAEAALDALVNK